MTHHAPSLSAARHLMDNLRELGNPKETIRYDHDPHFCLGVIESEIKDC